MAIMNMISICGSLRKGSYNAALARTLPSLAPAGMSITPAPSFAACRSTMPTTSRRPGFPGLVNALADADPRRRCGELHLARIQLLDPRRPQERHRLAVAPAEPAVRGQAGRRCNPPRRAPRRLPHAIRPAQGDDGLGRFVLNKPEIFIGNCAAKFDEKTGELKDETTRGFIKQQLAALAPHITRIAPKG